MLASTGMNQMPKPLAALPHCKQTFLDQTLHRQTLCQHLGPIIIKPRYLYCKNSFSAAKTPKPFYVLVLVSQIMHGHLQFIRRCEISRNFTSGSALQQILNLKTFEDILKRLNVFM